MTTGLVTPTEASVLAVLYTILIGFLPGGHVEAHLLAFRRDRGATALIMFITAIGSVMGFVHDLGAHRRQPRRVDGVVHRHKYVVLAIVAVALLVMGVFLEAIPVMLIAVPLFGPLLVSYGVDPIHFGVVLTYAILLGIVHPPIGLGIFAVCAITKLKMEPVVRATLVFYPVLLLCLLLLMFVPELSTWLPRVMLAR